MTAAKAAFSLRASTRVDARFDGRARWRLVGLTRVDNARRRVLGDMQITLFCFQKLIPVNWFMPNLAAIDLTNIS